MMVVFIVSALNMSYAQESEKNKSESDSTGSRELSINAYPYIYYTPETELAFGAGGILVFYTSDDTIILPSKVVLGGYYSTKAQYKVTLDPAFYFYENSLFVNLPLSFGYFVDKYFGIGPNSLDDGDEDYISRVYTATLFVQIPSYWFSSDRTGLIVDFNYTEMVDKQTNPELINNAVTGSEGGSFYGIGLQAVWDSRDNLFFPNDGKYSSLKFLSYPIGDFNFYSLELDVRHYSSFSEDHILAGQAYLLASGGDIPFYKVPSMGGQNRMRGYYYGRYRDNVYLTLQLEYRQFFWWRLGYVLFGGVGVVAASPDKLRIDDFEVSYGAGLRFLFNEEQKVNVRVDLGITRSGSTGIYFGIEEAF
jgi:outer membrane protein assembly factor BamA